MTSKQASKRISKRQGGKVQEMKHKTARRSGRKAEFKLTVSLIVKNEEKDLPDCLRAVRSLLDQVGGELIVTDTGSTDRTVEIAEEMADLVLHTEWKKDFAAARNFAIPYARGEWFMYVDADEILDEDLSDAVSFFQSGEYRRYNSASIRQRNYTEESRSSVYSDFFAIRLWKIHPDLAFTGVIHEAVIYTPPVRKLNLVAHHFGYAGSSEGKRQEKMLRNRELLQNQPENIRTLIQIADTYPMEIEKRIEIMERARKRVLDGTEAYEPWRLSTYMVLSREYYNNNAFDELKKLLEEYWSGKTIGYDLAGELDLRLIEGLLLLKETDLEKTEEIFWECQRLYERVEREELETPELHVTYVDAMRESNRYYFHIRMLALYHDKGLWEKMKEIFPLVPLSKVRKSGQVELLLQMAMNYVNQTEDISVLTSCYESLIQEGNGVKLGQFQRLLQIAFPLSSRMTEQVLKGLIGVKEQSVDYGEETGADKFFSLCKLCLAAKGWEKAETNIGLRWEVRELVLNLLSDETLQQEPYYTVLFYLGMKLDLEAEQLTPYLPEEEMQFRIQTLSNNHGDFYECLRDWLEEQQRRESISLQALQCCCYVASNGLFALTEEASERPDGEKERLVFEQFRIMCRLVDLLNRRLYLPEVLRREYLSVLPVLHQVGFYGRLALEMKAKGERLESMRNLKVVAEISPAMSSAVKILSNQMEQEIEEEEKKAQDAARGEFQALAIQVKAQILSLLDGERYGEAEEILTFYKNVNPGDPQIGELAARIQNRGGVGMLN